MSSETGKNLLLAHKHGALTGNKVVEIARDYVYVPMEAVNIVRGCYYKSSFFNDSKRFELCQAKLDPSKSTKQV